MEKLYPNYNSIIQELYHLIQYKNFLASPKYAYIQNYNGNDLQIIQIINEILKISKFYFISPIELKYKELYEKNNGLSKTEDNCSICMCPFYESLNSSEQIFPFDSYINVPFEAIFLDKCKDHFFHIECMKHMIDSQKDKSYIKCPICNTIYGILKGDMPPGTMKAHLENNTHCAGYKVGTIVINYQFPSGRKYSGTSRTCYLPNDEKGLEILGLLKVAFERKLTFKVGTSVTTGVQNTTVWNGIHHKTNLYGGPTCFGYPDPDYYNRVKSELNEKGVSMPKDDAVSKGVGMIFGGNSIIISK